MKRIHLQAAIFALCALILNGCSGLFLEKPQLNPEQETSSPDIPEGFGTIRVAFPQGAARTLMPQADLASLFLEYRFTKDGGTADEKNPDGDGKFILEPGTYSLEVKVYVDSDHNDLAAQGITDVDFTVTAGVDTGTVSVPLHPVVTGEGTGSLIFGLKYPNGTTLETFTLTPIAVEDSIDLKTAGSAPTYGDPVVFSGTKTNIPVGYYLLRVVLKNSAGEYAGKTEVVHIYQNLDTQTDLAAYTFTAANFSISLYMVTTTNDSGPGSLRQALTDMNTSTGLSASIQITLEPGSVIELASVLPEITKTVSIWGDGVILTRTVSWEASDTSQLLRINSGKVVTISGIHFKDGLAAKYGGAIDNRGTLTLESCTFSGNRSNANDYTGGGAVYSNNSLIIRGCAFYGNTSGYVGGAIYNQNGSLTLESCIFNGNSGYSGGAVYGNSGTIRGCTFYGNTASISGGAVGGSTLTLTGNIFYRNTTSQYNPVSSVPSVTASYNVVDVGFGTGTSQCGWDAGTGDVYSTAPLVVPGTFKVIAGSPAAARLPSPLPSGYPTRDFYGQTISGNGRAGAVQAVTANGSGYSYLELSVNNSLEGSVSVDPLPDADGLVPNGSVTLTAASSGDFPAFEYWLHDDGTQVATNPYTLTVSGHTRIQAVFSPVVHIFSDDDGSETTPGTLRYAITNARDGDIIQFKGVTPGTTVIELRGPLPDITKDITIEGNGVTLTRATSFYITSNTVAVTVRRVHFKDIQGSDPYVGGAFGYRGTLTLESCIFSGNRAYRGSAVYNNNTLTIRGCTFYGNTSENGGAVYFNGGNLTLEGNLFYGNTASNTYPVVMPAGTINASYNVVDVDLGAGTTESGWAAGTGDTFSTALSVSPKTFGVLDGSPAAARLPSPLPVNYPTVDFYGQPISAGGAAGAVQAVVVSNSSYLEMSVNNSLAGSVSVYPPPDADGLVPHGSVTLTATPSGASSSFKHWLRDDGTQVTTNPYTLTVSAHTRIQAVFSREVTVNNSGDASRGTLLYALLNAQNGDIIRFSRVTSGTAAIELKSALPEITKSITIEGNGVTLTRAASWTASNNTSQLLRIGSGAEVTIRGIHFKDGVAANYGGAIDNRGTLTLESCNFSGNQSAGYGGAVYNAGTLTLESCTFNSNQSVDNGGAVYSISTLTIQGCGFYENTSGSFHGGAIYSGAGTLTLESCIFSGNRANYNGGAVYAVDTLLAIRGCTFYQNDRGGLGGAIYAASPLTLTGNLFYGNTSSVIQTSGTVVSSYNVMDFNGWSAGTGDTTLTDLSISGAPFDTTTFAPVSALQSVLPSAPADFPTTDFYGATRTFPGAPGAVKQAP